MHGIAELAFKHRDGGTVLGELYQRAPLRVLLPNTGEKGIATAAIVTTSGGLVGGDRLDVRIAAGVGTQALVTQQAAEKVYRTLAAESGVAVTLEVARGGWLEWLPQETIVFEGGSIRRMTRAHVAEGGRLFAGEILVFGRRARGERFTRGLIHDAWEIRRKGRLVWCDAFRLHGDVDGTVASAACLAQAAAVATVVYVADAVGPALTLARQLADMITVEGVLVGVTAVGGVLIARWLGYDARLLRAAFGAFWAAFRHRVAGLREVLPRLWSV